MDDDIDVFAELGVTPTVPSTTSTKNDDLLDLLHDASAEPAEDPLAALMDGDEDTVETMQAVVEAHSSPRPSAEEPAVAQAQPAPKSAPSLTEGMVGQVVALLVQRGLAVDPRRLGLSSKTLLDVGHVSVERNEDLLIARADVTLNGTPMQPFAAVRLTEQGLTTLPPPAALPEAWHPMHDVLATALKEGSQQLEQALGQVWMQA